MRTCAVINIAEHGPVKCNCSNLISVLLDFYFSYLCQCAIMM